MENVGTDIFDKRVELDEVFMGVRRYARLSQGCYPTPDSPLRNFYFDRKESNPLVHYNGSENRFEKVNCKNMPRNVQEELLFEIGERE